MSTHGLIWESDGNLFCVQFYLPFLERKFFFCRWRNSLGWMHTPQDFSDIVYGVFVYIALIVNLFVIRLLNKHFWQFITMNDASGNHARSLYELSNLWSTSCAETEKSCGRPFFRLLFLSRFSYTVQFRKCTRLISSRFCKSSVWLDAIHRREVHLMLLVLHVPALASIKVGHPCRCPRRSRGGFLSYWLCEFALFSS